MKFFSFLMIAFSSIFLGFSQVKADPVIVVGGGVGAMTSALYLARAGFHPVVLEGKMPGGLLSQSHSVQNWPGELEISGDALIEKMRAQAKSQGVIFVPEELVRLEGSSPPFTLVTRNVLENKESKRTAMSCILAMGTTPNHLEVPGEEQYWGRGVSNCAICDGSLMKGKAVAVVGGGDAAVLEALYLANIADKVYLLVRGNDFRASDQQRLAELKKRANVQILLQTQIEEIQGTKEQVTQIRIKTAQKQTTVPVEGVFLAIGSQPNSGPVKEALKVDAKGQVLVDDHMQTSLAGIYAIGDLVGSCRQAICAAGDGAKAAIAVQETLKPTPDLQEPQAEITNHVIEIQTIAQFNEQIGKGVPVVVDFYAPWCGPCKRLTPYFEQICSEKMGELKFLKVNVDLFPELAKKYAILSLPTVVVFDASGQPTDRKTGTEQITKLLSSL